MIGDSARVTLFGLIICVLFSIGSCIKCYNCVSTSNEACLNPSSNSNLQPQECVPDLIKKLSQEVNKVAQSFGAAIGIDIDKETKNIEDKLVCQKIESVVDDKKIVIRGCQVKASALADLDYCKGVEKQVAGTVTHCSLCHEDGCNSAQWMSPLSTFVLVIPTLALTIRTFVF